MAALNHIHKYYKPHKKLFKPGKYETWVCGFPKCTSYTYKHLVLGKESICWRCEREIILTPDKLRVRKPNCDDCKKKKQAKKQQESGIIIEKPPEDILKETVIEEFLKQVK